MAMIRERTATPWWVSLVFGVGLLFFFVGERLGSSNQSLHDFLAGMGLGLVGLVTAARGYAVMKTSGARQRVERTLLLSHLGTIAGIVIFYAQKWSTWADKSHAPGSLVVISAVFFIVSLVTLLVIELSLGTALRTTFDLSKTEDDDVDVEFRRVREMAWSGLSIAFALGFLMVTCKVAGERNIQRDVSYFKTSSPGDSTKAIVANSTAQIRVLLFFPPVNEVKAQVQQYFDGIGSPKLVVEEHDREAETALSTQYKVGKDGAVVIVRASTDDKGEKTEKFEKIELDTDIEKARKASGKLRNLDKEVNTALLKVMRDKRKAYIVSGHGELTSPETMTPQAKVRWGTRGAATLMKKTIVELNYETKDLGLFELARDVPEDATVVLLLAPSVALMEAEWESLGRYLDRGGRLLIAMDPIASPLLGSLEGRLGVRFNPAPLVDETRYLVQRGTLSERKLVLTTQISSHASTTGLARTATKDALLMIEAGSLDDAPFTTKGEQPKKTYTINSLDSSFLDFNENYVFDATGLKPEKKQRYKLAAAIEGPKLPQGKDGFRALVFADGDWFSDIKYTDPRFGPVTAMIQPAVVRDGILWLGGEEQLVGDMVSEDDLKIQHTKGQDAVWFTLTIIGMPLLVLGLGLIGTSIRKRRRTRKATKAEVTS